MAFDDDLIAAALMEDEEDKALKAGESAADEKKSDESTELDNTDKDAEKDDDKSSDDSDKEDDGTKEEDLDDKKSDDDSKNIDDKPDAEAKKTRAEKRAERKQSFIESIKSSKAPTNDDELSKHEKHSPVDYDSLEELDTDLLKKDRDAYGNDKLVEGRIAERQAAEQMRFWDGLDYEGRILLADPKYAFLNDKDTENFDERRAHTINDLYLTTVGFDPKTKTVARTDLSYEKFVKEFVATVEDLAEEQSEQTAKNLVEQSKRGGVRPTGSAKKGLGELKPGDISRMSDKEYEENEAEIDRQIAELLK